MGETESLCSSPKKIPASSAGMTDFDRGRGFSRGNPLNVAGKKRGFRGEKNPLTSRGSFLP